jgi:hypothetical protein
MWGGGLEAKGGTKVCSSVSGCLLKQEFAADSAAIRHSRFTQQSTVTIMTITRYFLFWFATEIRDRNESGTMLVTITSFLAHSGML